MHMQGDMGAAHPEVRVPAQIIGASTPNTQRVRRREHLLPAFEQLPHNRPLSLRIAALCGSNTNLQPPRVLIRLLDHVVQPLNGRARRYSYEGLLAQTLPRYWFTGELLPTAAATTIRKGGQGSWAWGCRFDLANMATWR
jgi:hypothetical protein